MIDPVHWPIVEHNKFILSAISFDTAHTIYNYPYGTLRCVKRMWTEQAQTGAGKNQWRYVSQTTTRNLNYTYSKKASEIYFADQSAEDQQATKDRVQELKDSIAIDYETWRLVRGKPFWNAPHPGTYQIFACLEELACKPVPDAIESQVFLAVRPFYLTLNSSQHDLVDFLSRVFDYRQELTAQQIISLRRVESTSRRYNPSLWPHELRWELWGL